MGSRLKTEVKKFKDWADKEYPESDRGGEWECDYEDWSGLYSAFESFIANANSSMLIPQKYQKKNWKI